MSNTSNLKRNVALQTFYEVLVTCVPLITSPYLSRVLGVEKLGIYSFTSSVVAYFLLFSRLGTLSHGVRTIATIGDNKKRKDIEFWGIFGFQFLTTSICIVIYVIYLVFFCKENTIISSIQIIDLFTSLITVGWLFAGRERFNLTVNINIIVKIITVLCIIVFVNRPDDLWIYTLIMGMSTFCSQLMLWFSIKTEITSFSISWVTIIKNLKPSLMLFIPLLAMSVYHIMDKTMLGLISNYEQSGLYYNADKIVNISVGVISGISTVMLPRMSSLIGNGDKKDADNLFRMSLEGTALIGIAISLGIASIAKEFVPVFFGSGFEGCISLTIALSPVLIIKSFAFTSRYQYLIPHKKERAYVSSVIAGAIVNLIANCILIPQFGAMGAVIGTIIAELTACLWQYVIVVKFINLKVTLSRALIYLVIGIIMFFAVRAVSLLNIQTYLKILLEILFGAFVYIVLCFIYWKMTKNEFLRLICSTIKKHK